MGRLLGRATWVLAASSCFESRSKSGREQHCILISKGEMQVVAKEQHHLATRPRATCLDEAQIAGRNACSDGELELAQLARSAPFPELLSQLAASAPGFHDASG